ncbi:brassinosteroid-related acyltransferase 1-like [Gossypium arboreum]|uniref:Omega-hydroxypalmitate O-feruloyl transferase n=1 Tax=Gossypium arboreum TaxID=29729 RepID=A0ABR0MKM5_GOSAR|nr:brassinosteroid-related acyltransferase 1-like [Gossypium arboreum]KAK5773117.1 hypothetical protein PVK06_049421 [Gossypium arboreum]
MATKKHDDHENYPTVLVTKTVTVHPKPLLHHPQQILHLSNLDRQCPMLMYVVFFYKPCFAYQNLSLGSIFNSLKSGLEETLSIWYPAAGRLSLNQADGKLNLWCNNGGAVLAEAVTTAKIIQLGDLSQYKEFFERLAYKPVFQGNFSQMPLIVAQVTRFGCGGYSISIGASHSLFDGPATYDFLRAWASNSAILKEKRSTLQIYEPVHERGPLLVGTQHGQQQLTKLPESWSSAPTRGAAAIDHLHQLIKQALAGPDMKFGGSNFSNTGNSNLVLKTFHLSGAMIESLKIKVFGGESRGSFSFSSFELIAAHLWKARTKALGVKKGAMVCLQFAVDLRNKMVPPLPKGFSGNAFVLASIALTAEQLEGSSHEAIIEKIKQAKNSITNDYVIAYNKALDGGAAQGSLPPINELTLVSDWTRMPFHTIDFLHGEAAYVSPLLSPIPQVAYFMQNPNDLRGIDVRIGLPPQFLNAFSHYFLTNLQ